MEKALKAQPGLELRNSCLPQCLPAPELALGLGGVLLGPLPVPGGWAGRTHPSSPTGKTRFTPSWRRLGGNRLVAPPEALPSLRPGVVPPGSRRRRPLWGWLRVTPLTCPARRSRPPATPGSAPRCPGEASAGTWRDASRARWPRSAAPVRGSEPAARRSRLPVERPPPCCAQATPGDQNLGLQRGGTGALPGSRTATPAPAAGVRPGVGAGWVAVLPRTPSGKGQPGPSARLHCRSPLH